MLLTRTHFHAAAFARQSQNHGPFPSISFYREQFAEGLIPGERADWGNGNHIAALHEASMLAVSLLLAVVNGRPCKSPRSCIV